MNHAPFSLVSASRQPPRYARLVGDDADRPAVDAGEADDEVARPARRQLEQLAAVDQVQRDVADVVERLGIRATVGLLALGRRRDHGGRVAAHRIQRRRQRQRPADHRRQVRQHLAGQPRRVDVIDGQQVGDAVPHVHSRAAEVTRADLLADRRLDDLRTGQEHPRPLAGQNDDVAERRRVCAATGARAADDRDLRDARVGLRVEDRAVGAQRAGPLLQPRAARVGEADDRAAELVGAADRRGDRLAAGSAERAALVRAVLRPGADRAPVDAPASRTRRRRRPRCAAGRTCPASNSSSSRTRARETWV